MSWKDELNALEFEAIKKTMSAEAALQNAGKPGSLSERTVYGWRIVLTRFVNAKHELRWQMSASTMTGTEENLQRVLNYLQVPKEAALPMGGVTVDGVVSAVRHFLWAADS